METLLVVPVFTIAVALFAVLILLHFVPMGLWISALAADVSISLFNLVGMRFRRVEPRMIVIQPWEVSILKDIEQAIQKSDIGLNPMNDGKVIRLKIPDLTEERRKE